MSRVLYSIDYEPPESRESRVQWISNFMVFANFSKERNMFIEAITVYKSTRKITCTFRANDSNVQIDGNEHIYQLMEAMDTMIISEN